MRSFPVPPRAAPPLPSLALAVLLAVACGAPETPAPGPAAEPRAAASTVDTASPEPAAAPASEPDRGAAHNPAALHPYELFDRAEAARAAGDGAAATAAYRELVEWAASDPLGDGWGATALAPYALWRWAEAAHRTEQPDPAEVDALLAAEKALRHTRLTGNVFSYPLLDTLPQLRESTFRNLALLAHHAGRDNQAQLLFLEFLEVAREGEFEGETAQLRDAIVASGWASRDKLDLMRAKRLWQLRDFEGARAVFTRLVESATDAVRIEANLDLATLRLRIHDDRFSAQMRAEVIAMLGRVIAEARDPEVLQRAYYRRALTQKRVGAGQAVDGFVADLETLIRDFPGSEMAAEALYQLAEHHAGEYRKTSDEAELRATLGYYERLRALPTPHGREDSMYYRPALALYTRSLIDESSREADQQEAARLLGELETARPTGPFHLASLLVRARIAEQRALAAGQSGDREQQEASDRTARELFERMVREDPFGYFGLRARMHLESGAGASAELLPAGGVRQELARSFGASRAPAGVSGDSPYHRRLTALIGDGRYRSALDALRAFRRREPKRLQDVPLADLDAAGELADLALLLAVRQDAAAARDRGSGADNRIEIAAAMGHGPGDWPAALRVLASGTRDQQEIGQIQAHRGYLATAFPRVYVDYLRKAASAHGVPAEVLYAIVRHESLFDASAVSPAGAAGLFQFMPNTFATLARRWSTVDNPEDRDIRLEFLFDAGNSIDFGGRYLKDELLARYGSGTGMLFALMDHNAGATAVRSWKKEWAEIGRSDDIEYMVETARYPQTRILLRDVLRSLAIVEAAGLLAGSGSESGGA